MTFQDKAENVQTEALEPSDQASMTSGRAALVSLMARYLDGWMDPFVSPQEVYKLLYFLQGAGEPLGIRFQKAPEGPRAKNLLHALQKMEGEVLKTCTDGIVGPGESLELMPGVRETAAQCLASFPDTAQRVRQVGNLIEGYESSFGLELLATVHWCMTREQASTNEALVSTVHAWGARKRKFSPRQILLAAETLRAQGWVL